MSQGLGLFNIKLFILGEAHMTDAPGYRVEREQLSMSKSRKYCSTTIQYVSTVFKSFYKRYDKVYWGHLFCDKNGNKSS